MEKISILGVIVGKKTGQDRTGKDKGSERMENTNKS